MLGLPYQYKYIQIQNIYNNICLKFVHFVNLSHFYSFAIALFMLFSNTVLTIAPTKTEEEEKWINFPQRTQHRTMQHHDQIQINTHVMRYAQLYNVYSPL